jgi:hypothetical protein
MSDLYVQDIQKAGYQQAGPAYYNAGLVVLSLGRIKLLLGQHKTSSAGVSQTRPD